MDQFSVMMLYHPVKNGIISFPYKIAGLIPTSPLYSLLKKRYQREWGRINYRPSGSSSDVQTWKYFDLLSFLRAHIENSSRRIHTGFDPETSNFYDIEQPGPSRLNAVNSQEYGEHALNEFFVDENGYLTLAPVVAETHQLIQMSSSETNAACLMETPKTKPNEAIFAPGWRKRKMNQIEVLKSLKETNPIPANTAMSSINQKYNEIWASRLNALPYNSQAKVRRIIEEVLFEEESKQNCF
uniref:Uncharacterized protein n=1 Tax=Acrobeloides nanus TaxID=290746 RepID=A0A914DU68_9BILA